MNTNVLSDVMNAETAQAHRSADRTVSWTDQGLDKVVRLRLISDPGFDLWDVSYCWGVMKDGEKVRVSLPFFQISKRHFTEVLLRHARRDGVFAKGLGIFDAVSKSS